MNAQLLLSLLPFILPPLGPKPDPLALFRQWAQSPSPDLRLQAARSLRGDRGSDSRAALLSLLSDPHPAVRAGVRDEIAGRPPEEGPQLALEIAALRDARARIEGVRAILARREDASLFVEDREAEVRARALFSGRVPAPLLRAALRHADGRTRALALEALGESGTADAAAGDRAEEVRIAVTRLTMSPVVLAPLIGDPSWRVRLAAFRAAERIRPAEAVPALIERVARDEGRVRARAARALESLTGAAFGNDAKRWREWWARAAAGFVVPPAPPERGPDSTRSTIRFRKLPVDSLRLAFVLDASRSMTELAPGSEGKTRWDLVVRDLSEIVQRLPSEARFNVILFRTDIESWKPRLTPASSGARAACRKWIEAAAPAGWTNLFDALALALSDDDVDALYILTDGVPSRGAETKRRAILAEVEYLNRFRMVQINCVQAGGAEGLNKAWDGFLEELAKSHEGVSVRE